MSDPVHRAAPESARGRGFLTLLSSSVAAICFVAVLFMHGTVVPVLGGLGTATIVVALVLGHGLTTQAAAAPDDANPAANWNRLESETTDPIRTLKQRYAEGELTDAEFEERMDRLMESDTRTDDGHARERDRERAVER
ncbi:SHOCT domain-containing protein [Halolamina rubra]|uniref:SHOCT domain-containing protein n=1 Tax=Halolamina rubra TaxID=1380430 RepID=UPI0006798EE5|nr:SHOCT domain-containing protein [Halolamina rubra]